MEDITKILSSFGVPTAVAFFLLIQLQPKVEDLTKSILLFTTKLDDAIKKIDGMVEKVNDIQDCINKRRKS